MDADSEKLNELRRIAYDPNMPMSNRQAAYEKFNELLTIVARRINDEFYGKPVADATTVPGTPKEAQDSFIESA